MSKSKKKNRTNIIKRVVVALVALVLVFAVVIVAATVGDASFSSISARVSNALGGDTSFPVSVDSEEIVSAGILSKGFYVLTQSSVAIYNNSGDEKNKEQFRYTSPACYSLDNKLLVYDRGGTSYYLIHGGADTESKQAQDDIITAALGKRGNYALATRASDATSAMNVYKSSGEVQFSWKCAYEHITSIALCDNGKGIAAAVLGAKDGSTLSRVHVFNSDYSDELYSCSFTDELVLRVSFISSKKLMIVTDCGIYIYAGSKQEQPEKIVEYFPEELGGVSFSQDGACAVVLTKYGGNNLGELVLVSAKGKKMFSCELNGSAEYVNTDGKYIFIVADSEVLVYNQKSECVGRHKPADSVRYVFGDGGFVFFCAASGITRDYSVSGSIE